MNIINSKSGILHENDDFSPKNPRKRGRGQNRGALRAPFLSVNPPISKILDPPLNLPYLGVWLSLFLLSEEQLEEQLEARLKINSLLLYLEQATCLILPSIGLRKLEGTTPIWPIELLPIYQYISCNKGFDKIGKTTLQLNTYITRTDYTDDIIDGEI